MVIKDGFKLRRIGNDSIVVGEGIQRINFNKMIVLNSSAAYLWESITDKEFSVQDIADLLTQKYDIDPDTAYADSEKIVQEWINAGIVE